MSIQALIQQFLVHLEVERGRSTKTLENYERSLRRFLATSKVKKPADITDVLVHEFRQHLSRLPGTKTGATVTPLTSRTSNHYLIALRAFLRFLRTHNIPSLAPEGIRLAEEPVRRIDYLSESEIKRLLLAPPARTLEGKRDRALIKLLVSTGVWIAELCALSVTDVDLVSGEVKVSGARGRSRVVVLSQSAKNALHIYVQARLDLHPALFIRYGRKQNDGGDLRLTPKTVQRLLQTYAAKVGIARTVTPQLLRHTHAVNLLKNNIDLNVVQTSLGHAHLASTKAYTVAVVSNKPVRSNN